MTVSRIAVAITGLVCTATAVALADSRIEFKATEGQGAAFQVLLIGAGKVRIDSDKTTSVILDPKDGAMTMLDHSRKEFTRLTRADIDQLVKTIDDAMKQMEAAMAGVPPEMRERMKGMMGNMGAMEGGAVEIVSTGQKSTVAGRSCTVYQTRVAKRVATETCLADPSVIELSAADRATLMGSLAWLREMADRLTKGPLGRFATATPFRDGLVPLRVTDIAPNGTRSTSEFSGVSTTAIPADTFAAPSGYKERKIELPRMGRGR
jgi:hypothetical protein